MIEGFIQENLGWILYYFLFSSQKRLFDEEFRVELVMVNKESFDSYEPYSQTFCLITISSRGGNSYILFTD